MLEHLMPAVPLETPLPQLNDGLIAEFLCDLATFPNAPAKVVRYRLHMLHRVSKHLACEPFSINHSEIPYEARHLLVWMMAGLRE